MLEKKMKKRALPERGITGNTILKSGRNISIKNMGGRKMGKEGGR